MPVWVNKQTYRNRKNCRCFAGKVMLSALVLCLAFQLDALPTELPLGVAKRRDAGFGRDTHCCSYN